VDRLDGGFRNATEETVLFGELRCVQKHVHFRKEVISSCLILLGRGVGHLSRLPKIGSRRFPGPGELKNKWNAPCNL
jgi:hypothetical protein